MLCSLIYQCYCDCYFYIALNRLLECFAVCFWQIDSIMSTREANEHDASRRLKSEFLVQFDGVTSNPDDLVIVIGELTTL